MATEKPSFRKILWEQLCNATFIVFFSFFAYAHFLIFAGDPRLSIALIVIKEAGDLSMVFVRRYPREVTRSITGWVVGFGGTLAPMLLRPSDSGADIIFADILQLAGGVLQIISLLSLNRSFGLVAANRGVKRGGMYRFVRHPLYFSYTIFFAGYCINHFTEENILVTLCTIILLVGRIIEEEALLSRDPAYVAYKTVVRWRLIPGIY